MRSVVVLLVAMPALLLAAPASQAAATAVDAPAVSVSVSDGREDAAPGDRLEYAVDVENAGAEAFSGSVTLRVPDFVELEASGATIEGGVATWSIEVPAGGAMTLDAVATVGEASGNAYQVVTLAEVVDDRGAVLVRAADADTIPGADAPPAVAGLTGAGEGLPEWVMPVGIVGAVILAGSSFALFGAALARRNRPRMG